MRVRICGDNRRLATARNTSNTKCSSIGRGRIALKVPMNFENSEEQGNPNVSRKEGGNDLLRRRKQRRWVAELGKEHDDEAADAEAEARSEDDGGAQVRGHRKEEEGLKG